MDSDADVGGSWIKLNASTSLPSSPAMVILDDLTDALSEPTPFTLDGSDMQSSEYGMQEDSDKPGSSVQLEELQDSLTGSLPFADAELEMPSRSLAGTPSGIALPEFLIAVAETSQPSSSRDVPSRPSFVERSGLNTKPRSSKAKHQKLSHSDDTTLAAPSSGPVQLRRRRPSMDFDDEPHNSSRPRSPVRKFREFQITTIISAAVLSCVVAFGVGFFVGRRHVVVEHVTAISV